MIGEEDDDTGGGSYDHIERYVVDAFPNTPVAGQPTAEVAQPLLQFDGNGNLKERNLVALNPAAVDAVIAQEPVSSPTSGGPVFWMIDDNLGSPDEVLDDSGNVVDKVKRDSFGNVTYESAPTTVHWAAFAGGHLSAATALIISGVRWYDALTGRWLSQDPSGFQGHDANLSRYVANDITNGIDPTGEVMLFGQSWVTPWNANAAGLAATMTAYAAALKQGAVGTAQGAVSGLAAGAVIGGMSAGLAGGPMAVQPGMMVGGGTGAAWGAIAGVMASANAIKITDAIQDATIFGGGAGASGGLIQGMGAGLLARYQMLYTYTTTQAAQGIATQQMINAPVYATIIPPKIMSMPFVGFFAKLTLGWIGPYKNITYYPLQYCYQVNPAPFVQAWGKAWQWISNTPVPPGPGGPL